MNSQRFSFQIWRQFLLLCLMLFGLSVNSFAAPGDLDLSFGSGGKVLTKIGVSFDYGYAAALQPDGKIIVAGRTNDGSHKLVVVRLNSDGSLDYSFGLNGKVVLNFSYDSRSVVIQADGKIIVGGAGFALARLNSNGSLDTTFGANGITVQTTFDGNQNQLQSLDIQPDGKIVAAGFGYNGNPNSPLSFVVARYNADGSLDGNFDGDGKLLFDSVSGYPSSGANSVLIQPDGKILLGGTGDNGFRLVRLNADGTFDAGFGSGGRVTTLAEQSRAVYDLALQADGKIVAAGTDSSGYSSFVIVVRYNTDGSLDTAFDGDGIVKTPLINENNYDKTFKVGIQADGKIVVGGSRGNNFTSDFVTIRYNVNGSPDTTFDGDGIVITDVSQARDVANELIIQPDGKIILAGYSESSPNFVKISLARYNADGSLDSSFDGDGTKLVETGDADNVVNDIAIQPDGKIVAVGYSISPRGRSITVARYNTNGSLDASFGNGGIVVSIFPDTFSSSANSVIVQPDGKILVGGRFNTGNPAYPYPDFIVVRYNTDGSLDSSFGSSGKTVFPIGIYDDTITGLALQPDGKIVACGTSQGSQQFNPTSLIAVARLNGSGSLDTSFDGDGKVVTTVGNKFDNAYDVTIQADGKIVVAGSASNIPNTGTDFALVRYNTDGSLDTTFDGDGKLTTSFSSSDTSGSDAAFGVRIQKDGKIVAAGTGGKKIALARYNSDGSLDNSFDGDGKILTTVGSSSEGRDLEIQLNGKLVVAGIAATGTNSDSTLVRYNPDGSLDNSFGAGGVVITPVGNSNDGFTAVSLQADGKIVAGGYGSIGDNFDFTLARYESGDAANPLRPLFDFDGDGKADISVFRPSNGVWYLNQSTNGFTGIAFGFGTDKIVPADYDGDGKTDVAVFRPSNGTWYLQRSQLGFTGVQFGASEDIPVPADYDGDGKADVAVFRPSSGVWYLLQSSGGFSALQFGQSGDKPVAADYDGDGRADIAVFRPGNGVWYIERSRDHFTYFQFGFGTDKLVPADYDGDGKADIAVYRDGIWYIERSRDHFVYYQFGASSDIPAPADYDGDGKADLAVFRPSNGVWYLQRSQSGFAGFAFGVSEDKPVPGAFVP